MGFWVGISNRRNWYPIVEPKMSEGVPFRLNKYISKKSFEGILASIRYTDRKDV